jgi:hypothetical protein
MVWALSKQVFEPLPGLMEWFTLILGDTNDSPPSVIGPSYGKILLEKNLLQLILKVDRVRL